LYKIVYSQDMKHEENVPCKNPDCGYQMRVVIDMPTSTGSSGGATQILTCPKCHKTDQYTLAGMAQSCS